MTREELKTRQAIERKLASMLIYEARLKEHEAATWLNLPKNIEEAAANVHSALDAVLDATAAQIRASREQYGSAA
jgi:molecular chaperone DnaK (HSP70)